MGIASCTTRSASSRVPAPPFGTARKPVDNALIAHHRAQKIEASVRAPTAEVGSVTGGGPGTIVGDIERDAMNPRGRRPRLSVPLVLGIAVAAFAVWAVGILGIGQFGEDICLDDPPDEATGYQSEGSVWPPRLTCVYDTHEGDTLAVDHHLYPTVAAAWVVGFPLVATVGIGMICTRTARSSRQ